MGRTIFLTMPWWWMLLVLVASPVFADSPLTSCVFAPAYRDHDEVQRAVQLLSSSSEQVVMDAKTAMVVLDSERDLGMRLAVVNAYGFGQLDNIDSVLGAIGNKWSCDSETLKIKAQAQEWKFLSNELSRLGLGASEIIVIAYVVAMANYLDPIAALPLLASVQTDLLRMESGYWIAQLIAAQLIMNTDPCGVFVMFSEAKQKTFEHQFLRDEAKAYIMDYIELYELSCLPDEYTDEYYTVRPVYDTTQAQQKYSPAKYVDLYFVGIVDGVLPIALYTDNSSDEGGLIVLEIKNNGNVHSIPTNVYCEMRIMTDSGEDRLVRQAAVPGIPARATEIVTIFLPGIWWQSGVGTMELTVDHARQIMESNETNNVVRMGE